MTSSEYSTSVVRILVVDDEDSVLATYRRALKSLRPDWVVTTAEAGLEAMAEMEKRGFEVLITDIDLGGLDGIELLRWTKATFPQTYRMVLSGLIGGRTLVDVHLLAHAHLIKPIPMETLIERIETRTP